ncbi:MAG: hypothetical protein JO214_15415 [Frankiaceae bacterium]|nr:hypothetical protein [Frankiaceae bacterium]
MTVSFAVAMPFSATASPSKVAPDGGHKGAAAAKPYKSMVPIQVRDHSARKLGAFGAHKQVRLAIGLNLRHAAKLEKFNQALQDKRSPLFHHYLTAKQFQTRYSPSAASQRRVVSYAKSQGLKITRRYPNRLIVDVQGSTRHIESAFGVRLNRYSLAGKHFFSNDRDPVLPLSLRSVVSSVDGLNNLQQLTSGGNRAHPQNFKRFSRGPAARSAGAIRHSASGKAAHKMLKSLKSGMQPNAAPGIYEPTDIYSSEAYDENALHKQSNCCNPFHNPSTQSPAQSSIAIATAGSHSLSGDMAGWNSAFPYIAYSINEYYIDGTPSSLDYEGTMDTEWATSLANSFGCYCDTAHIYLYSGVNAQFSTFDDIYNSILTNNTAKIVSSSWGCAEFYCTPDATMNTDHNIFASMASQGFTLVNSSGDRGNFADCSHVSVSHPASDTYWLAIGATNLELGSGPTYSSQSAWGDVGNCSGNGGGTGGGCSAKYAAPSWQSSISGFCGSGAKALPDVSLNGDWSNSPQYVYFNGGWSGNGGTSISAPMMAGFYAQQNSYGIELGSICGGGSAACAPIGQAGPQLQLSANTHAAQGNNPMYDITSGCTTNEIGPGFCGVTGYDRATGWGTPNMLQFAWANNYWNMPEASPPTIAFSGPSTSGWVNSGTIGWTVTDQGSPASGVAGYTAQWDSDPGDQSSEPTPGHGATWYDGPASAHGATSGSTSAINGCHTLYVRAWDNIGESAVNSYGPVCLDTTAPAAPTLSKPSFVTGSQLVNGKIPVHVTFNTSDSQSGVGSSLVWHNTDGGAYVQDATVSGNSYDYQLAPAHNYTFAIGTYDNAGNFSGYSFTSQFRLKLVQETVAAQVTYPAGTWTSQSVTSASGGSLEYATGAGAQSKFTFSGTQVAWVGTVNTNRGSANVSLDGGGASAVNTQGAFKPRTLVYTKSVAAGAHNILISNLGTAGHPRIDVDAFAVIAHP